jgi:hypothetical protein
MRPRDRSLLALGSLMLLGLAWWCLPPRNRAWPEPLAPPAAMPVVLASEAPSETHAAEDSRVVETSEPESFERVPVPSVNVPHVVRSQTESKWTGTLQIVLVPREHLSHDTAQLVGRFVSLDASDASNESSDGRHSLITSKIAADLTIEFRDLLPDRSYSLAEGQIHLAPFAPVLGIGLTVRAGETTRVELPLEDGLALAGRVVNDDGVPVGRAFVHAFSSGDREKAEGDYRADATTQPDGTFRFEGLKPLPVELTVDCDGYLHTVVPRTNWGSTGEVGGIEILLSRGRAICGYVRLPNGRPVANAQIGIDSLREDQSPNEFRREAETATNSSGWFRSSRLYGTRFSLAVTARIPPEALATYGPAVEALGRREKAPLWTATITDAPLAPTEMVIVLTEAESK